MQIVAYCWGDYPQQRGFWQMYTSSLFHRPHLLHRHVRRASGTIFDSVVMMTS